MLFEFPGLRASFRNILIGETEGLFTIHDKTPCNRLKDWDMHLPNQYLYRIFQPHVSWDANVSMYKLQFCNVLGGKQGNKRAMVAQIRNRLKKQGVYYFIFLAEKACHVLKQALEEMYAHSDKSISGKYKLFHGNMLTESNKTLNKSFWTW